MVRVELLAITKEDKVDMEAESTRITTRAISPGLVSVGSYIHLIAEESSEASQEIASTCHHQSKDGGYDSSLLYGAFVFDGVEFLYHLRKAPGTQRC